MSIQNTSSINIFHIEWSGNVQYQRIVKTVQITADCYYRDALEGEESVELRWEGHEYSKLPVDCFIVIDGRNFYLTEPHEPTRKAEDVFTFNPIFYAEPYHWNKAQACCYTYSVEPEIVIGETTIDVSVTMGSVTSKELDWSYKGNLPDALSMLLQSIQNETGVHWTAVWVSEVSDKLIEIQAQGLSVFGMLTEIASQCGKEFYFDYSGTKPAIHIGTLEIEVTGDHTELDADDKSRVVLNVGTDVTNPQVSSNAEDYYTRFYFFGSTRNIVQPNSITKSSVVNKRLPLNPAPITGSSMHSYPNGFIDIDVSSDSYDGNGTYIPSKGKAYSKSVFFDDIYPHSNLKVGYVYKIYIKVIDDTGAETGELMPIYYVRIGTWSGSTFNPVDYDDELWDESQQTGGNRLPNLVPSISFRGGYLQGLEYELTYHHGSVKTETIKGYDEDGEPTTLTINFDCFEIIFDNNSNPRLPNDIICPRGKDELSGYEGDDCTLFNIKMPDSYIVTAQQELETESLKYIKELKVDKNTYTVDSNAVRFDVVGAFKPDALKVGTLVKMVYPNNESVLSRVVAVERHLDINADCRITLGYKASQGTLKTLREIVADTSGNVETVVKAADKNKSQINGLRNGYRVQQETLEKVFDTDGYFDTDNIRPLSIDTSMLSVGVKSQQFTLSGITFSIAPFASGYGTVVYTGGKLSHFTIDETTIKEWTFNSGSHNLVSSPSAETDEGVWYIYAKCSKSGTTGDFDFSQEQKLFDSDTTYWYFLVGIISSRMTNPENQSYYIRYINMTYGTTTVNGRQITTGRIQSADGNTFFDLDQNKIKGNIVFESGGTEKRIDQYIADEVGDEISGLGIDGTNLLPITNYWEQGTTNNESNPSYTYADMKAASTTRIRTKSNKNLEVGEKYTLHCGSGFEIGYVKLNNGYGAGWAGWSATPLTFTVSGFNSIAVLVKKVSNADITPSEIGDAKVKLESGETATNWTLAPEDVADGIDAINGLQVGGHNLIKGTSKTSVYSYTLSAGSYFVDLYTKTINRVLGAKNYVLALDVKGSAPFTMISHWYSPNTTTKSESSSGYTSANSDGYCQNYVTTEWKRYWVKWQQSDDADTQKNLIPCRVYQPSSGTLTVYIRAVKFEVGTVPTDWSPAPEDTDYLRNALNEATSGSTEILGGLILTKMIQAGSGASQAGMAGLNSSIVAFWAGGTLQSAAYMGTPISILRDGNAKIGRLRISAEGDISMPVSGKSRLEITGNNMSDPPTAVWSGDAWVRTSVQTSAGSSTIPVSIVDSGGSTRRPHSGTPVSIVGSGYIGISASSSVFVEHMTIKIQVGSNTCEWLTIAKNIYVTTTEQYIALPTNTTTLQYIYDASHSDIVVELEYGSAGGVITVKWYNTNKVQSGTYGAHLTWYSDVSNPKTVLAADGLICMLNSTNYFRSKVVSSLLQTSMEGQIIIKGNGSGSGQSSITGCSINGSSDRKFKTDVEEFDALPLLEQLKFIAFHWNELAHEQLGEDTNKQNYGIIAQDNEGIIDGLVFDEDEFFDYKRVSYITLIPILGKAINELAAKNAALEARIAELEARINL